MSRLPSYYSERPIPPPTMTTTETKRGMQRKTQAWIGGSDKPDWSDPARSVAIPIAAYQYMAEAWALPIALMKGTRAMRDAGVMFLPRVKETESEASYRARLQRTFLYNIFRYSVEGLISRIFSRPALVFDDAPEAVKALAENIDFEGRDLTAFAQEVAHNAMVRGHSCILVDYPTVAAANRAEEMAIRPRPYFVHLCPSDIIGWRFERNLGGIPVLTQLRFNRTATEHEGEFGEKSVDEIVVIDLKKPREQRYAVWRQDEEAQGAWRLHEERLFARDDIPLVIVYTHRTGRMTSSPPLLALAEANLEHWQVSADHAHARHTSAMQILFWRGFANRQPAGATAGEQGGVDIELGAFSILKGSADSDLKPVVLGANMEKLRSELQCIESRMALLALQPLTVQQSGGITATEVSVRTAQERSNLQSWAMSLKDALEQAIALAGQWTGEDWSGVRVDLNTDYGLVLDVDIDQLIKLNAAGGLSTETLLRILKQRGLFPIDIDIADELDRLETARPFSS